MTADLECWLFTKRACQGAEHAFLHLDQGKKTFRRRHAQHIFPSKSVLFGKRTDAKHLFHGNAT